MAVVGIAEVITGEVATDVIDEVAKEKKEEEKEDDSVEVDVMSIIMKLNGDQKNNN